MAYSTFSAYKTAAKFPKQSAFSGVNTNNSIASRLIDCWGGQQPSNPVALSKATSDALQFENGGAGRLVVPSLSIAGNPATYILCDRLSHQGGLSGIVTTTQTTNLPTAALTRYTSGEGVMAGLTIHTAIGATATTATASYTNEAGTSGRTTQAFTIGSSGWFQQWRLIILPLAAGDSGVREVASVTLAASTGTAGNIGVTLFKPLIAVRSTPPDFSVTYDFLSGNGIGGLPEILDNACLFWCCIPYTTSVTHLGVVNLDEC